MNIRKGFVVVLTVFSLLTVQTTMAMAKNGGNHGGGNSSSGKSQSQSNPVKPSSNSSTDSKSTINKQTKNATKTGKGTTHPSLRGLTRAYLNASQNGASPRAIEVLKQLIESRGGTVPVPDDTDNTTGGNTDTSTGGTTDSGTDTSTGGTTDSGTDTSTGGSTGSGTDTSTGGTSGTGTEPSTGGTTDSGTGNSTGGSTDSGTGTSTGGSTDSGAGTSTSDSTSSGTETSSGTTTDSGSDSSTGGTTGSGTDTSTGSSTSGDETSQTTTPVTNPETVADQLSTIAEDPVAIAAVSQDAEVKTELQAVASATLKSVPTIKPANQAKVLKNVAKFMQKSGDPMAAVNALEQAVKIDSKDKATMAELKAAWKSANKAGIKVYVKGQKPNFDGVQPVIENGRTLVPVRAITEALGATVQWNAGEQKVTITQDNKEIILTLGSNEALINGEKVTIDVPGKVVNNRTFVPLRFISETLKKDVSFDPESQVVTIDESTESTNQ
ncbi:copper amine oxidase N-terminal domain-containing protein [Heliobacterium chlorum]|uniref:Copper amine oxidase N-terminal domain-containing protein n=1 Tax=Heliobacterium chlorum TaxID=2698 RepID=A0ABR7T1J3_HELCL|nr:copper amine oxidase N-terminal domain-containing protein [Heliobacterium chlorum]MBC9784653.1 copper amine oxidase N-terminal domain-containing protein [Heliobacterium chlorum]